MKTILKNKHLITLGLAETISGMGSWITMMAVFSILIFKGGGNVWQSSGIMLAGLLPLLIFSPLAGKLADRFSKKYLMMASELLSAAVILAIFLTQNPALIYVLIALQAALGSVMGPARQALVPALVSHPDELTRANAFLQQLASFIKIGAPMLAGLLITWLGPYNAMLFDVLSFILGAGILFFLPNLKAGRTNPGAAEDAVAAGQAQPGLKPLAVIWRTPALRLLFVTSFLMIISVMAFDILGAIYTRDILQGDESMFGLLIGAVGLGTVLSGFYLLLRQKTVNPWQDLKLGLFLLMFLPGLLVSASFFEPSLFTKGIALVSSFIGGVGVGFLLVQLGTLLQTLSPPAILGTISGYYQASMVAGQLISILGAPLLVPGLLGMTAFLFLVAVCLGLVWIYMAASVSLMQRRQFAKAAI
ncbi:MAG: MFS transporter [Anaerolineae bacterium]|nr:MFS transporter [Anaerolineae bacterium]